MLDAAVPELAELRRALVAAREDLVLGFGAAPLAAAAGSFATIAGADFSPGRGADLLLLVQPVQRRGHLCAAAAGHPSIHTSTRARARTPGIFGLGRIWLVAALCAREGQPSSGV